MHPKQNMFFSEWRFRIDLNKKRNCSIFWWHCNCLGAGGVWIWWRNLQTVQLGLSLCLCRSAGSPSNLFRPRGAPTPARRGGGEIQTPTSPTRPLERDNQSLMFIDLTPLSPSDQAEVSEAHYAIMESVNTVPCHYHHYLLTLNICWCLSALQTLDINLGLLVTVYFEILIKCIFHEYQQHCISCSCI